MKFEIKWQVALALLFLVYGPQLPDWWRRAAKLVNVPFGGERASDPSARVSA